MLKKKYIQKLLFAMAGILLGFSSCDEPFKDTVFRATTDVSAAEWIMENPDFSDWVQMLETVNRLPSMNIATQRNTFFVVKNEQLNEYARSLEGGYNSIHDLPEDQLLDIVMTHSISRYAILSKNMIGRLPQKTSNGKFLTVGYDNDERLRYINNGPAKPRSYIVGADIEVINGYVQVLDWPIITQYNHLWAELEGNENYSIFCEILRQSGWFEQFLAKEDSMVLIGPGASPYATAEEIEANLGNGTWTAHPYTDNKTVFVIPNSVFIDAGFEDADAFRMEMFPEDTPTDPNSDYFEFIRYHVVNRILSYEDIVDFPKNPSGSGYLKQNYIFTMCERQPGIAIEDQDVAGIFLNPHSQPVQISYDNRNILASNGYLHEIDGFLYIPGSMPHFAMEYEFTDQIQFSAVDYYRAEKDASSEAQNFYFYSGNIPGITWVAGAEADAKVWYSNLFEPVKDKADENAFKNFDGLFWQLGSEGTLTIETPKLPVGKYDLWIEVANRPINGGMNRVQWGDVDVTDGAYVESKTQQGLHKVKDNRQFYSDYAPRLKFVVRRMGVAGIDRAIVTPRT